MKSLPKFLKVDDPYTGGIAYEGILSSVSEVLDLSRRNRVSQKIFWNEFSLSQRKNIVKNGINALTSGKIAEDLAVSITKQMGKPLAQSKAELNGAKGRAEAMLLMADEALKDIVPPNNVSGFRRKILLEPIGQILTLSPWNYPVLTAINSIVPAVICGCSVVVSHGPRSPEVSFFIEKAFEAAGAPKGLVTGVSCTHETMHESIRGGLGDHVVFTGSVIGGHAVNQTLGSLTNRFVKAAFELGGKDPAYVSDDVISIESTAASIVDGAFYNAGQSCCAIERVYVHEKVHDQFVESCKKIIDKEYLLGDPLNDPKTTIGPMAQASAIPFLEAQVIDAIQKGARVVTGTGKGCRDGIGKGRFFSPTLLDRCTNDMDIVREESFGPVLPVIKVKNEDEAVNLMNDSRYGLTAAIYTSDVNIAEKMSKKLVAGTVYMNRCDYLDPFLSFSGRKDSGNGLALSQLGFSQFVLPKSLHFRL